MKIWPKMAAKMIKKAIQTQSMFWNDFSWLQENLLHLIISTKNKSSTISYGAPLLVIEVDEYWTSFDGKIQTSLLNSAP